MSARAGDDWTAFRYKRGQGCTLNPLVLVGMVGLLAVAVALAALTVGVAVRAWEWAL